MKRGFAFAVLVAAALPARAAYAEVRLIAPRGCGSVEQLRSRVEALAPGVSLDADVSLEREVSLARARVVLKSPTTGERSLEGADCDSVVEAAALVIAMSARIAARAGAVEAKPAPPPATTPRPTTASPASPPPPAPPEPRRVKIHLAAFATVERGTLAATGLGAGTAAGVHVGQVRGELAVAGYATQRTTISGGVGGEFSLISANLRGCVNLPGGPALLLAPCVGLEVDRLAGDGFGATTTASQTAWMAGPSVGGLVAFAFTRAVAIRLLIEGTLPMTHSPFVIGNVGSVHRPAALFGRGQIGPEVRF